MAPVVQEYTPVEEAVARIKSRLSVRMNAETVRPLASFGRVLAEDLVARRDVPAFPTSHMDGFAVVAESLKEATPIHPVTVRIVGSLGPGQPPASRVGPGEAIRVATGAGIPVGANAVAPVESVKVEGRSLTIQYPPEAGSHIYAAGEEIRRGEPLLGKGRVLRAEDTGLLIGLGIDGVRVYRKPRVSILPTGSELTSASRPKAGKIPESHSPVFQRLCVAMGCEAIALNVVGDESDKLTYRLKGSLSDSDMILTLGGTSAGGHDLVVDSVSRMRPSVIVHGLKLDRGRVTGIAAVGGKPILMMPGPIQAAMNAFLVVGGPLIEALSGRRGDPLEVPCALAGDWAARKRFADFRKVVYVKLEHGDQIGARPLAGETESIRILSEADGYFVVPEAVKQIDGGSTVRVRLLPGRSYF